MQTAKLIQDQKNFIDILKHDTRGGVSFCFFANSKSGLTPISNRKFQDNKTEYICQEAFNNYITLNSFNSKSREAENCFNICAWFVDLDFHELKGEDLNKAIKQVKSVLTEKYQEGKLARPTISNCSGRGLQLFYVLEHSISRKGNTVLQIAGYNKIYKAILDKFDAELEGICKTDRATTDLSRVVRLPGTLNLNNNEYAYTYDIRRTANGEPFYFNFKTIIEGFGITYQELKNKSKMGDLKPSSIKIEKKGSIVYPMKIRFERMQKLQALRGEKCVENCRDLMLFISYSALTQYLEKKEAVEELKKFNENFVEPLADKELEAIIKETDNNHFTTDSGISWEEFYCLSDEWVIDKLAITTEEAEAIEFHTCKRAKERQAKRNARRNLDLMVLKAVISDPKRKYTDIATELFENLTPEQATKKVKNICKKYGLTKKNASEVSIDELIKAYDNKERKTRSDKGTHKDNIYKFEPKNNEVKYKKSKNSTKVYSCDKLSIKVEDNITDSRVSVYLDSMQDASGVYEAEAFGYLENLRARLREADQENEAECVELFSMNLDNLDAWTDEQQRNYALNQVFNILKEQNLEDVGVLYQKLEALNVELIEFESQKTHTEAG